MSYWEAWMGPDPVPGHPQAGMQIWGWMSPDELAWLQQQASGMNSVVEVGSLHGRSAFALLTGCPGSVYCIDPWDDAADQSYGSFMGSCGHFANLVAIRGFSPAVAADIPDIDMVFIDGMHDEASVVADIEGWLPKTRKLICGHDYVPGGGFPDVAVVVDRVFGQRVKVADNTAIWYVEL